MRKTVATKLGFWMIVVCLLVLAGLQPVQAAVPGLVSFQGHLTDDDGVPLDGDYDMTFFLYNVNLGGSQLWTETQSNVAVTDGIYNVQLGAVNALSSGVFNNGVAWLEVVIDGEVLSPRQRITAAAYALKAADADALIGNTIADLDARYVQEGEVGKVTSAMIADSAVGTSEIIDGQVSVADLQDGTARAEILDDDGAGSGLDADFLDGYTSGDFVLTSQDYGRFNITGNLYEGTTTLTNKYVNQTGDSMTGQLSISNAGTGLYSVANPAATTVFGVRVDANQSDTNNFSTYGLYLDTDSAAPTGTTYGTYSNAAGNYVTYGLYGLGNSASSSAYGVYANAYATAGYTYGVYSYANQATGNNNDVYGYQGYAYGRGTGDLWGSRNYTYHYGTTTGTTYGTQSLAYGSDTGTAYGVYATAANAANNYGGYFTTTVDAGIPVVGLQSSAYTTSDLSFWAPGGLFGGRNGVVGFTEAEYGYGAVGEATGDSTRGVYGVAYGASSYGGYFYGSGTSAIGVYAYGTLYAADFNGNVRIRSGSTTVMELGAGLDYAEGFDVSDVKKPEPGSVLIIDPDNPGKLTLSTTAYDTKVAGIVAGANDLGSGVRLGGDQFDNDVALAGRVYCNVDATRTAINTGDLLTTSDLPGYAMKVGDGARAQGAILGKAMQDMARGEKGQILVLVTLQ